MIGRQNGVIDSSSDIAHEIGHFLVAKEQNLLKENYGISSNNKPQSGTWKDLDNEIQVSAIEYNIVKHFYPKTRFSFKICIDNNLWNLEGYSNYKKFHKLNNTEINSKIVKACQYWGEKYTWDIINEKWNQRNLFLRNTLTV